MADVPASVPADGAAAPEKPAVCDAAAARPAGGATCPAAAETDRRLECPLVALGASAGGLRAFRQFLQATPHDLGMAYVLIQHLDPTHDSLMAGILAGDTSMPVVVVEDGMRVVPDRVYVMPPGKLMRLSACGLHLHDPPDQRQQRLPIDYFFRSLAADHRDRAVAIVLSGTGSDGTEGLRAIKYEGGLTLAQAPATAEHDGMPRSAVASGAVDFVLPVEEMPGVLRRYGGHAYLRAGGAGPSEQQIEPHLDGILAAIRGHGGYDFRSYKATTLVRRIQRRMGLQHVDDAESYRAMLAAQPDEARRLVDDLLINVTAFFREPQAWRVIEERVVPAILDASDGGQPVRCWVPGCSTGEEAYSLAIVFAEQMAARGSAARLQIYASDISDQARERGRIGLYPANIAADVTAARLARWFAPEGGGWRVCKQLREAVVFAQQNLLSDPPFSRLDLVSCRNLLIYLRPEVQEQVIATFHFALNGGGFLMLGGSESLGGQGDLFVPVSKKHRIWQRRGTVPRRPPDLPRHEPQRRAPASRLRGRAAPAAPTPAERARDLLLAHFAPAAVLVDAHGRILHSHGELEPWLRFPPGEPSSDLLAVARPMLHARLRSALRKAARSLRRTRVLVPATAAGAATEITVLPQEDGGEQERHFLVCFAAAAAPSAAGTREADDAGAAAGEAELAQLEDELQAAKEDLQAALAELEESSERHRTQSEEIMSMNEELQSTNEELETSKEELQSLNDELSTLNHQLEAKLDEVVRLSDDLSNLLASTNIAVLFLDPALAIRRFTPAAGKLLNLRPGDVGRPYQEIASEVADGLSPETVRQVLRDLNSLTGEVATLGGRHYLRRIQPYRTQDDRIEGVVITFTDICELKQAERERELARAEADLQRERLARLFMQAPVFIAVHEGPEHVFVLANHACQAAARGRPLLGRPLRDALPLLAGHQLVDAYDQVLRTGSPLSAPEVHVRADQDGDGVVEDRWYNHVLQPLREADGSVSGVMSLAVEVTQEVLGKRRQEELAAELRRSLRRTEAIVAGMGEGLIVADPAGTVQLMNEAALAMHDLPGDVDWRIGVRDLARFREVRDLSDRPLPSEQWPLVRAMRERFGAEELVFVNRMSGRRWIASVSGAPVRDESGELIFAIAVLRDVTQRHRHEQALAERSRELARSNDELQQFASLAAHDLQAPLRLIASYLDLLRLRHAGGLDERGRGFLDRVVEASLRMRELVTSLLDYSRLGRDEKLTLDDIPLDAGLDRALAALQAEIDSRAVEIVRAPLPAVRANAVLLAQCFQNLVHNALLYCDKPRVRIAITATAADGWVEVAVTDNGPGINPAYHQQIFEIFKRLHRRDDGGGSGIGLAFCRKIVDLHGGRIWVESQPGQGATFRFTLPAAGRAADAAGAGARQR